jgi:hypothetical protein
VAGDNQKPGLVKFPVGSLALPGGKGRRIPVEIGDKLNVVTKMTKHMLQLVCARASDLPTIVPMLLNYTDHLVDIGADERTQRNGATVQSLPRVAAPYCPQRWLTLNRPPAARGRGDTDRCNCLSRCLDAIYELLWLWWSD